MSEIRGSLYREWFSIHDSSSARSAQVRRGFFARQARPFDTRQTAKPLAPSSGPVVDRKSASVRMTDRMSWFTMPIFKMVMEHGVHVFKVQGNVELPSVSDEELHQLVCSGFCSQTERGCLVLPLVVLVTSPATVWGWCSFLLWLTCAIFCCLFGVDQLCCPARTNYSMFLEPSPSWVGPP